MIHTEFFNDFLEYYRKADILEKANLVPDLHLSVNDPLMESIAIYDTVHRRQAGFSKILEDIHGKRIRKDLVRLPDYTNRLDSTIFHFLHLFHRFTGSGASFQPTLLKDGSRNPKEHGYNNSLVGELAALASIREDLAIDCMRELITTYHRPMVSSIGNQPPSLKNPDTNKYRLAMQYYFDQHAKDFVHDYLIHLVNTQRTLNAPTGIKEAVDFSLDWHSERKFKRWKFVITAFVMDTAEYYPDLVDPSSHCYYGANCIKSFNLMFEKEKSDKERGNDYFEKCMTEVCQAVQGRPYDVEDVCCDYIRYVVEYVPKGYEHLTKAQATNNCTLKVDGEYPEWAKIRMERILK
jgi:hypothetical protein